MKEELKKKLFIAICRNNFNYDKSERESLFQETVELIETQARRIAELEAESTRLKTDLVAELVKNIQDLEKIHEIVKATLPA
ncbi:MAG: hypothetical protein CEN88_255 [Candidatus Berkelbacteria bacterium Licking1014_2]|uniref:Uncharacterized protein n=1 Tax=Candidatus Berkelbacteria bacterium Licking1014_2 TaxID=2017146 RepID=A0A554LVP7_9BACT|nr:MAG: hypothetical protein CEN88_255 [Candidatus Berkelbacteria bacterium Licking1014_2]